MKCQEFFNLLPEECMVLEYRFSHPGKTAFEVGETTEWGEDAVLKNERQAITKIASALRNLGVIISKEELRVLLGTGRISLEGIVKGKIEYK